MPELAQSSVKVGRGPLFSTAEEEKKEVEKLLRRKTDLDTRAQEEIRKWTEQDPEARRLYLELERQERNRAWNDYRFRKRSVSLASSIPEKYGGVVIEEMLPICSDIQGHVTRRGHSDWPTLESPDAKVLALIDWLLPLLESVLSSSEHKYLTLWSQSGSVPSIRQTLKENTGQEVTTPTIWNALSPTLRTLGAFQVAGVVYDASTLSNRLRTMDEVPPFLRITVNGQAVVLEFSRNQTPTDKPVLKRVPQVKTLRNLAMSAGAKLDDVHSRESVELQGTDRLHGIHAYLNHPELFEHWEAGVILNYGYWPGRETGVGFGRVVQK